VNVIVYWKSGEHADVYNVDEVRTPTPEEPSLRAVKKLRSGGQGEDGDFEVARFEEGEIRGWQVFLTLDDARRGFRA
jgi:hypothetical protein